MSEDTCRDKTQIRYFIAKVNNFPSLKRAVQTSQWACADRSNPPQPHAILSEAFSQGRVVIIFSVSNCHGWHGFAEMLNIPGHATKPSGSAPTECETDSGHVPPSSDAQNNHCDKNIDDSAFQTTSSSYGTNPDVEKSIEFPFRYFDICWKLNFLQFGEQCLGSKETDQFSCIEKPSGNKILLNKCRNWQEVDAKVGESVCEKLQEFYTSLCRTRDERLQRESESKSEPFYKPTQVLTVQETWRKIVTQVEKELGKVILACPFGSQRYNLQTANSDTDMFIVYQAKTRDILGFHPPKHTIKNHESEQCDYTIHEVFRYCELLLSGDARCVETLFLHESTVVQDSPEWHALKQGRSLFLNRECLDKYLRDAQGSKGTKYLQKWCKDNPEKPTLPAKLCKMLYVIVRLLQNARNIVDGEDIMVYREPGTPARDALMSIRAGDVSVTYAWQIIKELEDVIDAKSEHVVKRSRDVEEFLENWLMTIRYENFHSPTPAL